MIPEVVAHLVHAEAHFLKVRRAERCVKLSRAGIGVLEPHEVT